MSTTQQIFIRPATIHDAELVANIGRIAVELSHRDSCSSEDMNHYMSEHYNLDAIKAELANAANLYHLIYYGEQCAGFSKVILNTGHPNISALNVTKLDRIYLLQDFFGLQLGYKLLQFDFVLARKNNQSGIWLFTWTGNQRAVNFYKRNGFEVIGDHLFKVSETHYNPNYQMILKL